MIMKFTSKINVGAVASMVLAVAALGSIAWLSRVAPAPPVGRQDTLALQESFEKYGRAPIIPAVDLIPAASLQQGAAPDTSYIPVSAWYKDKGWWKRHAPIIGGAAGGGVIGGLAGGGKGALIGGAAGAGGGYLYKHLRDHNHHHGTAYRSGKATPQQPQHGR